MWDRSGIRTRVGKGLRCTDRNQLADAVPLRRYLQGWDDSGTAAANVSEPSVGSSCGYSPRQPTRLRVAVTRVTHGSDSCRDTEVSDE